MRPRSGDDDADSAVAEDEDPDTPPPSTVCPECGGKLVRRPTVRYCPACGYEEAER